jgi:hypothetical protein
MMVSMIEVNSTSRARLIRRWLPRFSLRTLLILVSISGALFGYLGHILHRRNHQRHIVAQIAAAGGKVRYNWQLGMGVNLDPRLSADYSVNSMREIEDGLYERTRVTSAGTFVETERPPGPKLLRRFLGNDLFAHVESVDFFLTGLPIENVDPRLLWQLPQCKVVTLFEHQVNNQWLDCVARIPKLRVLGVIGHQHGTATAEGLSYLESARELEDLTLSGEWLQDDVLKGVANLRQLKGLYLSHPSPETTSAFVNLEQLTDLCELSIRRAKGIDDRGSEVFGKLPHLRILQLSETSISDATLCHLSNLNKLEWLDLSGTKINGNGLAHLANLSRLKILDLSNTQVGDANLHFISHFPELKTFRLQNTAITDAGLTTIARMSQLEHLELWRSNLTNDGIQQLHTLTNLKDLSIGPGISKAAADKLRAALPNCEIRRVDKNGSSGWPDYEDTPETPSP